MLKWLKSLLGSSAAGSENEAQLLRLELAERDKLTAQLKADLERLRRETETRGAASLQAQFEKLFADVAAPVAQLQTQAHLLEVENRPVQARDVLAVAKRLARALEDNGLGFENRVGEQVAFDPNRHEPLTIGAALHPGQPVIIRFVGVTFRGKLLSKAGVETALTPTPLP